MLGSLERLVPRFRTDINMIGRHLIIATGHQGRGRFAHDQFLSGEIPEKRLEISLMVVEAQHVQGIRAKQMIRWVYLVTAGGNDPGGIQTFHDTRQMTGDQGLTAKGRILQQSGIDGMARIQDQVRRLQIQLGSVGMTPLLKYLIAYTPHENRGVIPVTQDLVRQIPLVPLREIPGVIVRGLTAFPHIERLILYQKPHTIAKIQQLGCRGVMAGTDRVRSHLLHDPQLALDSPCIHGGTQTA